MTETPPTDRRPGVRGIGSTERRCRYRYRYGGVCGVAAVAYAVTVLATSGLQGRYDLDDEGGSDEGVDGPLATETAAA